MRSTHRCLGLDGPGPSGFNERIHKKQVLPYLGSSENYLFPCVSSEPNFNPTNIFGILVFKGSFKNVLKSKQDTFLLNHLARKILSWISKKITGFSYAYQGFTFPNYRQINVLTNILHHQLHNQTQISADYVLAQLFAALMNAITVKWLNETEDMDWSVNKQLVKRWEKNMSTNWWS